MEKESKKTVFLKEFLPFIICLIIGLGSFAISFTNQNILPHYSMCFAYIATSAVPMLIFVLFRFRVAPMMKIILYVFSLMSLLLANVYNFYELWDNYDTFLHFLSGPICCLSFLYLLTISGGANKLKDWLVGFISLFVELGFGAFWEIIEYFLDAFNNNNSQHYVEEGVVDTMHDILAEAIGGCAFVLLMYLDCLLNKRRIMDVVYRQLSVYTKYDYRLSRQKTVGEQ